MLENKNTMTEVKKAFVGLLSRLDTAEERIPVLEETSIEITKIEKQRVGRLGGSVN